MEDGRNSVKNLSPYQSYAQYQKGYFTALNDVLEWVESHTEALSYNKLFNKTGILAILGMLIDNRYELMENKVIEDMYYDKKTKRFYHKEDM